MWKKILSLSVTVLLVAGCSSGSPNQASEGNTEDDSGSSSESVTLNVAVQKHSAVDALETLLPEFEEETGIQVNFDTLPQNELKNKIELDMASSTGQYDVVMYDYVLNTQYAEAQWIKDLSSYIESNNVDLDDFFPGFLNAFQYNDTQYAMPFFGESLILMYNQEIFDDVGIEDPPSTMQELKEVSQKIKDAGYDAIAMRGARGEGMNVFTWASFFLGHGANWFDKEGNPTVNSQESVDATQLYAELLNDYGPSGASNFTWDQVQLSMQQGTVAMVIDSLNFAPRLENPENSQVVGKVGYAMIPAGPAEQVTGMGTWGMAIPEGSKNPDAAFEFVNWATSADIQLETSLNGDRADATRKSVWEDAEFQDKYNYGNWAEIAKMSMDKAEKNYRPPIPEWRELGDRVSVAISDVLAGEDPQKALDQAQQDLEKIFSK